MRNALLLSLVLWLAVPMAVQANALDTTPYPIAHFFSESDTPQNHEQDDHGKAQKDDHGHNDHAQDDHHGDDAHASDGHSEGGHGPAPPAWTVIPFV